jgi:transposase
VGWRTRSPGLRMVGVAERRLRLENEQLKLALAEQMVQLRLWQKGAEHMEDVPSVTSKP